MSATFTRLAAVKAAAIMTLSTYVTIALGLVVSAVIARSLGPHDYGRYAYLLWLAGLLISLGNHGIPITATRFISEGLGTRQAGAAGTLHGWLQKAQWLSVAAVAVLFAVGLPFFQPIGWEGQTLLFAVICLLSFIPKSVFQFDVSVAKGHGAFWVEAWGNMIISLLYTCGVIVLASVHASLEANLWWFAAVSLTHLAVILPLLKKAGIRASREPMAADWRAKLKHHLGWTSLQVFVATMSNRTIETYLLSRLIGPAEVGFFAIATNLTRGGIELLSSSLSTVLMPSLAHAKGAGGLEQVKRIVGDATRYFLFMGIFLAGVGMLWAAAGIHIMYGSKYEAVVPVLQAMVLISGLLLVENPFSSMLLVIDDQRIRTSLSIGFFVLSAVTALLLVPRFGLMGAVAANGITRCTTFGICAVWISRHIGFSPPWRDLGRLALSGLIGVLGAGAVLLLSSHMAVQLVSGGVFAALLSMASVKLGVWKRHDVSLLISIAERKPGLFGRWLPSLRDWQQRAEN